MWHLVGLILIILFILSGVPEYIERIDEEIREKHRKTTEKETPKKKYPKLKRVK